MDGYWTTETRIKSDATPIDDVTKFAWDDEDYETVEVWHEYTPEEQDAIDEQAARARENTISERENADMSKALCMLYEQLDDVPETLVNAVCRTYARRVMRGEISLDVVPEGDRQKVQQYISEMQSSVRKD